MSLLRNKLGIKSTAVLVCLQASLILVLGIFVLSSSLQSHYQNLKSVHGLPAQILQHGQFDASILVDAEFLTSLMNEEVREVLVLNGEGGVIVAAGESQILMHSKRNTEDLVNRWQAGLIPEFQMIRLPSGEWIAESMYSLFTPLGDQIHLLVNTGTAHYQGAKYQTIYSVVAGGVVCIIFLPLLYHLFFVRGFGQRVESFLEVVRNVTAGDQGARIVLPDSPDEFSDLQLEFNALLTELDRTKQQLASHASLLSSSRIKYREIEAQWQALTQLGDDYILRLDASGRVLDSNLPQTLIYDAQESESNFIHFYETKNKKDLLSRLDNAVKHGEISTWIHQGFGQDLSRNYVSKIVPLFQNNEIQQILLQVRLRDPQEETQKIHTTVLDTKTLLSNLTEGLMIWDLTREKIEFSFQWCEMLGLSEAEMGDSPEDWFNLVHPEDVVELQHALQNYFSHYQKPFQYEYRIKHDLGGWRVMRLLGRARWSEKGILEYFYAAQTDITDRKLASTFNADFYDALTGLPNLNLFKHHIERAVAKKVRGDYHYSLLMLQIREYENVVETLGATVADQLLASVARQLKSELRPGDLMARLENGRFTILLDGVDERGVIHQIAGRVQQRLEQSHSMGDTEVYIQVSIAGILGSTTFENTSKLLHQLEYNLKQSMRLKKILIQDPASLDNSQLPIMLQTAEMREALRLEQFSLVYQPVISLATREVSGFEALARWQHPKLGELPATQFLHKLEASELMPQLFECSFIKVCEQLTQWNKNATYPDDLWISLNISKAELLWPPLLSKIDKILERSGADPSQIVFEVTEEVLYQSLTDTAFIVAELKERGIHIQLDDFGTSHTSLQTLKRFPVDKIKIDSLLLKNDFRRRDEKRRSYLHALVSMAHSMQIEVIAEGIEDAPMLYHLQPLECDYAQGYCFAPPLSARDASEWVGNQTFI